MKISLQWIADFVDLGGVTPAQIAELLSMHTAEVEGVQITGAEIGDVVVGEVVECSRHPDADKLSVTRVDFGGGEAVPVVCGAPNVRRGLKVAFAPAGSSLPGGVKLRKAKLRGQLSLGMICSARELDLGDDQSGIIELPPEAPVGTRLVDYLGLGGAVLELDNKSLTHRPDLWGHYGFAREIAALLQRPLAALPVASPWSGPPLDLALRLEDPASCPLYLALEVRLDGVPRPSPAWLQQRLRAVGQRPVNDVVDLSNYVLLELGQPTHAFDWQRLAGPEIRVRRAAAGERLTTLDGVARELSGEDLVIADAGGAVALAGVMGGLHSEVSAATTTLLLESAVFQPARVRRSAQRQALRTEASARFEKSLDPGLAETALRRFAGLLAELRPQARVPHPPARAGGAAAPHIELRFDPRRAARLLGVALDDAEMARALRGLGFELAQQDAPWRVQVPSWRATKDVTTEVDLVEEVGRVCGYQRIRAQPMQAPVQPPRVEELRLLIRRLSDRLAGAHQVYETQGYLFHARDWAERLGLAPADFVPLSNPVQQQVDLVRRDPLPALLEQAAANARERPEGALFEVGKGYLPRGRELPQERRWLAALFWHKAPLPADGPHSLFGRARTVAEDLLRCALVGAAAEPCGAAGRGDVPWAHPARALRWISGGRLAGWSAAVDPRLAAAVDLRGFELAAVLLDLEVLAALGSGQAQRFAPPAKFPAIKVDVALAVGSGVPYAQVEAALRRAGGRLLESLTLFDVYTGAQLGAGARSLAFHALLRASDRTLTEEDEQKFLARVEQAALELGGKLRK